MSASGGVCTKVQGSFESQRHHVADGDLRLERWPAHTSQGTHTEISCPHSHDTRDPSTWALWQ